MFGRASEISQFNELLVTGQHVKAMRLFDQMSHDPNLCRLVLETILMSNANHHDPQLHTPHGLQTTEAGRAMLAISGFPAGVPLLRFLTLYSFSLRKRDISAEDVRMKAKGLAPLADPEESLYESIRSGDFPTAGAILPRIAIDRGLPAAAHAALRFTLNDTGKLGHHLALAVSYLEAARALDMPRGLLPLATLGFYLGEAMQGTKPIDIATPDEVEVLPSGEALREAVEANEFDEVEAQLKALLAAGRTDEAVRPLLVAASADPGFLGHTLILAHSLRLAAPYLAPAENFYILWKAYRTLVSKFGYPEFLRLGGPSDIEPLSVMAALRTSLQYKTPPAETTLRQALEVGIPLDEILATIVNAYGQWTVGEKEHTIISLGAALETAKFLGRDDALLPLAVALMRLPF